MSMVLKRSMLLCVFVWTTFVVFAQSDTIFLRNGQSLPCTIVELFYQRVSYTMTRNEVIIGPEYFDNVDLNRIVFANGDTKYFNVTSQEREVLRRKIKRDSQGGFYLEGSGQVTAKEGQTAFSQIRRYFTEMHGPVNPELITDNEPSGLLAGKARSRTSYSVEGVTGAQDMPIFLMFDVEVTLSGLEYKFRITHIMVYLARGPQPGIAIEKLFEGYRQSGLSDAVRSKDYDAMRESLFFHLVTLPERVNRNIERQTDREPRSPRPE